MKKLLLLTFLFTSFLCEAQRQIPLIEWQKTIGGSSGDILYSVQQTRDRGFIISGESYSPISGEKSEVSRGASDYWILKLDSNRNIKWQRTIGGSGTEIGDDSQNGYGGRIIIKETSDGSFIIGGNSNSGISGDKTSINIGGWDYWVLKLSNTGTILWQKTIGGYGNDNLNSIKQTTDGGYILAGTTTSGIGADKTENIKGGMDYWIVKLNDTGAIQWQKDIGSNSDDQLYDIEQTNDNGFILAGYSDGYYGDKTEPSITQFTLGTRDYWVVKLDSNRNIQWQNTIGGYGDDRLYSIIKTNENGYILGGFSESNISGDKTENSKGGRDYWIIKIDSVGNLVWQKDIGTNSSDELFAITKTSDGGCVVTGRTFGTLSGDKTEYSFGGNDIWVAKISGSGKLDWEKTLGGSGNETSYSVCEASYNTYIIGGNSLSGISGNKTEGSRGLSDYWLVRLNLKENPDSITGKVYVSKNNNCTQESNEFGKPNIIVQTQNNGYLAITDTLGRFNLLTDTGTYQVRQIIPITFKPFLDGGIVCPAIGYHTISFSQYGQDTSEINFANYEKQCAYLQVELAQSRMRRCFDNATAIKYCNIGNVDTSNVQVIVTLPEYVTFVSASNPNYTISGKKITFNIGALLANQCGTINLITKVDCVNGITGLTQCISAYILPRNKCVDQIQPDYALWDKSEVSVDGSCTGNTARFVIKNIEQNNMTDSSSYRIYKDAVQAVSRKFKLIAGDSLVINVTALGFTYRLEADQVAHFPSASTPNVTIENCGTGTASRGFVNQMPQNTVAPDVEKICLPIRDSYDPNDKSVSPSGVGTNKLVKHKVPLDFMIRFQNTGTDTAYTVVIVDTLDQNLDLSTLEFGASSHPYKIEFTGSGKPILKFTFDKINLVDSFTNEPKSHGFVSFKITPYDSIPNGTLVKNSADIYFDFNLPIKTNTTQVSIDDRLPTGATLSFVTAVKEQKANYEAIYVYPNPFTNSTNFEFVYNTKATQLIVYNINGDLVANENITNQTTYQFHRNNLSNGMYFYVIQNKEGEIIGRGKLVLQ